MRLIGKIGKRNIKANRILKEKFEKSGIRKCEIGFDDCLESWLLQFCHKEKREWYRKRPELLSDMSHVIIGCQHCHAILDDRSKTTKEESDAVFNKLRK